MFNKRYFLFFCFLSLSLSSKEILLDVKIPLDERLLEFSSSKNIEFYSMENVVQQYLQDEKLNAEIFFSKYKTKYSNSEKRYDFLVLFFKQINIVESVPAEAKENSHTEIFGKFGADFKEQLFRNAYFEIVEDLERTRNKNLYVLSDFEIENNLTWFELGVQKKENFKKAIVSSWDKLLHDKVKNFDSIEFLEKDFSYRPDYFNLKSKTIKWKSIIKKVAAKKDGQSAIFEFHNQYIILTTKTNEVVYSYDFPILRKEYSTISKKDLSSEIASLVFNLLNQDMKKIGEIFLKVESRSELESLDLKLPPNLSLSEVTKLNYLLGEKGVDLNLKAYLKSYSQEGAIISIQYQGDREKLGQKLLVSEGKYPLNEKKILFLNLNDQSFAILPKEPNN